MAKTIERPDFNRDGFASLSTREEQVLSFAAAGYLDKQIGLELGVSINTLRTYWQRIRSKVGEAPRSALAVGYVEHVAEEASAQPDAEPDHDWEIDLNTLVIKRVSSRPLPVDVLVGEEVSLEEILSTLHPEDQPRIRSILVSMKSKELSAFTYTARRITPTGIVRLNSFVRVEFDSDGKPVRAMGRRLDQIDPGTPPIGRIEVGYWTRDMRTGEFSADDRFCQIFKVEQGPGLRDRALKRFHPDEIAGCRTFVTDTVAAGLDHARRTHRLVYDDGSIRWITTDLRVEYEEGKATIVRGTVMAFD